MAKQSPTYIINGTQEDIADHWNALLRGLLQLHAGLYVMFSLVLMPDVDVIMT